MFALEAVELGDLAGKKNKGRRNRGVGQGKGQGSIKRLARKQKRIAKYDSRAMAMIQGARARGEQINPGQMVNEEGLPLGHRMKKALRRNMTAVERAHTHGMMRKRKRRYIRSAMDQARAQGIDPTERRKFRKRLRKMDAPIHGASRWQYTQNLPMVAGYDMDDEGLGDLDGFKKSISKVGSKVKKVAKKAAPIAIPVAGVVLAPFTGGASLAVAAAAQGVMMATKGTSKSEAIGAGILGAGAVGYGASQGVFDGAGSAVSKFFSGGSSVPGGGAPQGMVQPAGGQYVNVQAQGQPEMWPQQTVYQEPPRNVQVGSPAASYSGGGGGFGFAVTEQERAGQIPVEYEDDSSILGMSEPVALTVGAVAIGGLLIATMV